MCATFHMGMYCHGDWTVGRRMLGDLLAQTKVEKKETLDRKRFAATGLYAGLIVGPIGHGWYSGLDSFVLRYYRPATFAFVASKVGPPS